MPSQQFHNVCFTCNACNPSHGETHPDVQYCIFGLEIAPSTGKQHMQGYYQFKKKITLKWYKENICSQCHVENAKGTYQQNVTYCSKDKQVISYGTPKCPGKRTDLDQIVDEIKAQVPMVQIIQDHPSTYVRNYRGIRDVMVALDPPQYRTVVRVDGSPPTTDVYHYYCSRRYQYPYHGQTNCVVHTNDYGEDEGGLWHSIRMGDPCCINDVPCKIVRLYRNIRVSIADANIPTA